MKLIKSKVKRHIYIKRNEEKMNPNKGRACDKKKNFLKNKHCK